MLGDQLNMERRLDEAAPAFEKVSALNPKAGVAYNSLGYVYLAQHDNDKAITAFQKYADLDPTEPNPLDSLAEALTAAGRYDEAEAAYQKALAISPAFHMSWAGIAQARFLRGDSKGGYEALAKAKEVAPRPVDKLEMVTASAWSTFGEGKTADALKTLDGLEKDATEQQVATASAFAPIDRATMLTLAGKPDQALKVIDLGLDRATKAGLPGAVINEARRRTLTVKTWAYSKLGKVNDAKTTLAQLQDEAKTVPGNARIQSQVHFAEGEVAMASKDAKGAAGYFAQCVDEDYFCHYEEVNALEKAGSKPEAQAAKAKLASANRRDAAYLWVHAKTATPAVMNATVK
jgi:tetratricopeptide (TPR) repeat protein